LTVAVEAARMPSHPRCPPPAGACDCHAHVFGLPTHFPALPAPPLVAPREQHLEALDRLGATRGVLVQPTTYGVDCTVLLDALRAAPARLRGVAAAPAGIGDEALAAMDGAGVRGLRFVAMTTPADAPYPGGVGTDELERLAPRLTRLGWHAELWAPGDYFARHVDRLARLGVPLVIEHMGLFDAGKGIADRAFAAVLDLVREGLAWVKLSLCRVSRGPPDYSDVRPFHDALLNANPDRMLWGSDWPYIFMRDNSPDAGLLLDRFREWVPNDALARKILVDNPAALYGFESAASERRSSARS
jgi:2-pyrone-4,6-dicarboxylate lactonase